MRAAFIPRRSFPTPRVPHSRLQISQQGRLVGRGIRANSSATQSSNANQHDHSSSSGSSQASQFWTPARAFLASAFTAGLGYGFASYNNQGPPLVKPGKYGSAADFDKVWSQVQFTSRSKVKQTHQSNPQFRQFPNCEPNSAKTPSAPMKASFSSTASQNGQLSMLIVFRLQLPTQHRPSKSQKSRKSVTSTECPWCLTPEGLVSRPISQLLMEV